MREMSRTDSCDGACAAFAARLRKANAVLQFDRVATAHAAAANTEQSARAPDAALTASVMHRI
jgi:hypothetical protein